MTESQIRNKLRQIGKRRQQLREREAALQAETLKALGLAKGVISTTEAATLVGLNRSTVYEVYGRKNGRGGKRKKR